MLILFIAQEVKYGGARIISSVVEVTYMLVLLFSTGIVIVAAVCVWVCVCLLKNLKLAGKKGFARVLQRFAVILGQVQTRESLERRLQTEKCRKSWHLSPH